MHTRTPIFTGFSINPFLKKKKKKKKKIEKTIPLHEIVGNLILFSPSSKTEEAINVAFISLVPFPQMKAESVSKTHDWTIVKISLRIKETGRQLAGEFFI